MLHEKRYYIIWRCGVAKIRGRVMFGVLFTVFLKSVIYIKISIKNAVYFKVFKKLQIIIRILIKFFIETLK